MPRMMERGGERGEARGMRAQFRGGPLAGGGDSGAQSPRGVSPGGTRNLTTNGHATSGEPSLPPRPGIHYLLVPCQPPNRHSYLILIYYLPRSVPAITRSLYPTFRCAFRGRERDRERDRDRDRGRGKVYPWIRMATARHVPRIVFITERRKEEGKEGRRVSAKRERPRMIEGG